MPGGYPVAPEDHPNESQHRRELARTSGLAMSGHINSVLDLELTAGTETTLTSPYIHPGSWISAVPLDAGAVAEAGAGTLTILAADIGRGTAVVRHSAAATARTFRVAILG